MLECNFCENYLCMYCARDLIKQELKRTKQLVPVPPEDQIEISCPHCLQQSVNGQYLYADIDKSKPVKLYTDSPQGTVILTPGCFGMLTAGGMLQEDEGGVEESKVAAMGGGGLKVSLARVSYNNNSHHGGKINHDPDQREKAGLKVAYEESAPYFAA